MSQNVTQRDQAQKSTLSFLRILLRFAVLRSTVVDDHESMYPSHPNESKDRSQRALGTTREDTFKVYRPACQGLSYRQVKRLVCAQLEQRLR